MSCLRRTASQGSSCCQSTCRTTRRPGLSALTLRTATRRPRALLKAMTKAKIPRNAYMIWSAHDTGKPHVCGPKTCGSKVQADATQWTFKAYGVNLDESLCYEYFFAGPPAPV